MSADHRRKNYDDYLDKQNAISREKTAKGREIGSLPTVADPGRRAECERDLLRFCLSYFPARFSLDFSPDHLALIGDLQRVVLEGGQLAVAMPRGSGKTTLAEVAGLWAAVYGHRRFIMLVGATEPKAVELLESLKAEVETNDPLADDFPEVCFPVRELEGINNRANGQTLGGERTRISWTDKKIQLPRVAGAASSGVVVRVAGITGSIRGASVMVDGAKLRPDLVIVDDPQTDDSARSPSQVLTREGVLNGAVLGLAGPGKRIAVVMPCTVVRPGDLADRSLDRERSPQWAGRRCKLLDAEPTDADLWDEYAEVLRKGLRADPPTRQPATEFYRRHRAELDAGAVAAWPARFNPDELSAVQHAMNLKIADPRAFYAEYQNQPAADESDDSRGRPLALTETHLSRCPRGEVPPTVTRITAGVDVQQEMLFWFVVGWDEWHGGQVLDYGGWPDQRAARFSGTDPLVTLSQKYPGRPLEARLFAGLESLAGHVLGRDWIPQGGGLPKRVERCLVDAGWGEQTDTVHQWARQSAFANVVTPSKGVGIGAKKTPFSQWKPRDGERSGPGWRLTGQGRGRLCLIDTNYVKSFVAERLRTPPGVKGGLALFGSDYSGHALLGDHLASETPVTVTAEGRRVDEWQLNPGRPDNHWLDCYDEATEVLTGGGWRSFGALTGGESLATVNLDSDRIEYQQPTALIAKPHDGPMVAVGGGRNCRLDMLVTPTHRMVIYAGQSSVGPVVREANTLTVWDKIKTASGWDGDGRKTFDIPATAYHPATTVSSVDLAEFMGWFVSEGSAELLAENRHRVTLSQSKPQGRAKIDALLSRLPWRFHWSEAGAVLSNEQCYRLVAGLGNTYTMRAPQWVKDSPPEVIAAFMRAAVDGDGWRCRTGEALATVSRGLADDYGELWLKLGYAVSERVVPGKPYHIRGRAGANVSTQYHVHRKTTRWSLLRDAANRPNFRTVDYRGMVYCATVPNGTLIVKRNGKVAVCGNCLVMATAAAGVLGVRYDPGMGATGKGKAPPVRLSERQKERRVLNAR